MIQSTNRYRAFSVPSDTSHSSAGKLATASVLVVAMFVIGWLGGRHGTSAWAAIKQATIDSYQNRYRVMSDSGLDSIVYYVSTKDSLPLYAMAEQSTDIIDVAATRIKDLYDVRIKYASRVPTVRTLRSMDAIDAVITVPLFCH